MNTQPILEKIRQDAKQAYEALMREAENRVLTIHEQSDQAIADMREKMLESVQMEGEQLAERMRRLAELEHRKTLLAAQRALLDRAFSQALSQLRAMPPEQLGPWVEYMAAQSAQGHEHVRAGALNDAFFTADFVKGINADLVQAGKPGALVMDTKRAPGVTGLVLFDEGSEVFCTVEAALQQSRLLLETRVAEKLFGN